MRERSLLKCLESISPKKWYEFLNGKVFLWATLHRLEGLLNARAYRGKEHVILMVDARGLRVNGAPVAHQFGQHDLSSVLARTEDIPIAQELSFRGAEEKARVAGRRCRDGL